MRLRFAGTRGNIPLRSPQHARHSCLRIEHEGEALLLDCGADWRGRLNELEPLSAVVVTHAHPDHVDGLRDGWGGPVWATAESWKRMRAFPLVDRQELELGRQETIAGVAVEAIAVQHSLRAPAIGVRLRAGRASLFYVPDVAVIPGHMDVLAGLRLYIGDGATFRRFLLRRQDHAMTGHAPMAEQMRWCAEAGVPRVIFTHCGSAVLREPQKAARQLRELGDELGLPASFVSDGSELEL